jgi:hypothetical protein
VSFYDCPNCAEQFSTKEVGVPIYFRFPCPKCKARLKLNGKERFNKVLPNALYLSVILAFIVTILPGSSLPIRIISYVNIFAWGGICFYFSFELEQLRRLAGYNPVEVVSEGGNT